MLSKLNAQRFISYSMPPSNALGSMSPSTTNNPVNSATIPSNTYHPYFSNNLHEPPFSSIVQVPIREILEDRKKSQEAKQHKELFTLIGPSLLLLGGVSWMLKSLPEGATQKLFGRFIHSSEPVQAIKNGLDRFGSIALAGGTAFLGANGILAGITSQQPSMIVGNIIQFIPAAILMLFSKKASSTLKNIALSSVMATGATFTVGLANEIRNKDKQTSASQKVSYNMENFKALTSGKTAIPFSIRVNGILTELGKMIRFSLQDHARLLQNIPNDVRQVTNIFKSHPNEHPSDTQLKTWFTKPSADKSELAALFFYLGALPVLLLSKKIPNIANNKLVMGIKGIGMLLANLSLFSIAMNRSDIKGKAPLLGVPMAVVGMASGKPFFLGMGNVGESINNLLYSDMAVNGLKTTSQQQNITPIQLPAQAPNTVNPFVTSDLTKRYQVT